MEPTNTTVEKSSSHLLAGEKNAGLKAARPFSASQKPIATHSKQLFIPGKFITHHPKSGINSLVDSAAYLFSVIGKLKQIKSYHHLNQLQKELIDEINQFQEVAKSHGYSSDFTLVSRYALCVTLDDIISNTPFGSQGQWEKYQLQMVFNNNEAPNYERFFIILDRLVKDPALYIDLMEFMYFCLSLGFKGNYRDTDYGNNQLEQISDALYKRIRAQHGNFNKTLSPFPLRPASTLKRKNKNPIWGMISLTVITILAIFIGLGYLQDSISNQAYQALMNIGKSMPYETTDSS